MYSLLSFIGALIPTYWLSRLLLRVPVALPGPPIARLVTVHAVSAIILGLWIGSLMMGFGGFLPGKASVVVMPQLIWLAMDLLRGRQDRPARPPA